MSLGIDFFCAGRRDTEGGICQSYQPSLLTAIGAFGGGTGSFLMTSNSSSSSEESSGIMGRDAGQTAAPAGA